MPSIIPAYVYTLFASIIVGTLVITSCALTTVNVKTDAEKQQLSNITDYLATKSMELMGNGPAENLTLKVALNLPPLIGNQRYWVQIQNNSQRAWIEAGFGAIVISSEQQTSLPANVAASGFYISGSGTAFLNYNQDQTGAKLTLNGGS
jgi:hypothetical protein